MRDTFRSVLGWLGLSLHRRASIERLVAEVERLRGAALAPPPAAAVDAGDVEALRARLAEYDARAIFSRVDYDYDAFDKEKRIVDNIADFGATDFAELSWLFASSLINHRVMHQRFDEGSLVWRAVKMSGGPILEIGRAAGGSTVCILGASGHRPVVSIDRDPQHAVIVNHVFSRPDVQERLTLYVQSSRETIPETEFGMIFIDADHSYEGVCHDIATYWHCLRGFDGKPPLAVFHDAADNPITYVEPVKRACDELVAEPGVARVVESWGSLLVVEKTGEIDRDAWYRKEEPGTWQAYSSAAFPVLEPTLVEASLHPDRPPSAKEPDNLLRGQDLDAASWTKLGVAPERLNATADHPVRLLRETAEDGAHGIETVVEHALERFCFTAFVRPVCMDRVRLAVLRPDREVLAQVDFRLCNESRIEHPVAADGAEIVDAAFLYGNGFFRLELAVALAAPAAALVFAVQGLDAAGAATYPGDPARGLLLNLASVRRLGAPRVPAAVLDTAMAARFEAEAARVRDRITATPLSLFGSPYIVVDDLFSADMLRAINDQWPAEDAFQPEVPGNWFLPLLKQDFGRLAPGPASFWRDFNERLFPAIVAAAAEAMTPLLDRVFDTLPQDHFRLQWPLALVQADETYAGHSIHTHMYHNPNWVFTVLVYVDPDDTVSQGTELNFLHAPGRSPASDLAAPSNYAADEAEWRAATAMHTLQWASDAYTFSSKVIEYKANRMLVFLDGPLAFHSVRFVNEDHSPDDRRAIDGGRHARRRIIRTHTRVCPTPFYERMRGHLAAPIADERFQAVMAVHAELDEDDLAYRRDVIQPFVRDRITTYAAAIEEVMQIPSGTERDDERYWRFFDQVVSSLP